MDTAKFKLTNMHGGRGIVVNIPEPTRGMSLRELFYHSSVGQIVKALKTDGKPK